MKKETIPCEWIYFAAEGTTVGRLEAYFKECGAETEIWDEAGVIEIQFPQQGSADVELVKLSPKDELACRTAEKYNCPIVFLFTFSEEAGKKAEPTMRYILEKNGGIFCADTETLEPVIKAENK